MSDSLSVSSSFSPRNQTNPVQKTNQTGEIFELNNVDKIIKPAALQNQDNDTGKENMFGQENTPTILMGLLKDPAVTVSFLRNISMMQELIKLLPANNNPISAEIEQLFNSLLVAPGDISAEILMQENNSTQFKGDVFDMLRNVLSGSDVSAKDDVVALLKALSSRMSQGDVLNASANSLQFLGESLAPSSELSQKLLALSAKFRAEDAAANFNSLKEQALKLTGDVQRSILFSPKLSKVLGILGYNLSRVNTNKDFLEEATTNFLNRLSSDEEKFDFLQKLNSFLNEHAKDKAQETSSKIMDVLTKIIGKQAQNADLLTLNSDKIEKIIQSLLSSPCNFTPLLHYVIPVEFMDMKAFAEMWVNPHGGEDERPEETSDEVIHLLVVFDIENIGRFETELYAKGKTLDLSVLCPPDKIDYFKDIGKRISQGVAENGYRLGEVKIDKLQRTRSLMEVFRSLPYKRTGVDVTI